MNQTPKAPTAAYVLENVLWAADVNPDKVFKRDGKYVARFGYFYTNGRTVEKYEAQINAVPGCTFIEGHNRWNVWPKESYFEIVFDYQQPA